MKKIKLNPDQIIVPKEYKLGNTSILQIYFRVFDKKYGEDFPYAIVVRSDFISKEDRKEILEKRPHFSEEILSFFEAKIESKYYLIDGNHKSAAAALTRSPVYCLELETDEDLEDIREMVERGELFSFPRTEKSLEKLVFAFEDWIHGYNIGYESSKIRRNTQTVKERVDELVSNKDIPNYMIERYLEGNEK